MQWASLPAGEGYGRELDLSIRRPQRQQASVAIHDADCGAQDFATLKLWLTITV